MNEIGSKGSSENGRENGRENGSEDVNGNGRDNGSKDVNGNGRENGSKGGNSDGNQAGRDGLTAIVAGSTGMVGLHLVRVLLGDPQYAKVVVLARRGGVFPPHPKLEERVVDFDKLAEAFEGSSGNVMRGAIVYCALGTTIRKAGSQKAFRQVDYVYPLELGRLAADLGTAHFLIVTAMGADPDSRVFYSRVKGEVELALQGLALPRLSIFRPSLLLGERQEMRTGERIAMALAPLMRVALRGPLRKYRPIAGQAVAMAMAAAASRESGAAAARQAPIVYASDRIEELALTYRRV